ncbi:MAG: substrate-binding domain-containing protein, partial [Acidimicrobiia bacterium]|nr:substrate-binding domain-containing protein [Acidimicrobiia bacterium]
FGHSDQPGVDCALALEQSGFLGNAAAASLGASDEALVDLRGRSDDESVFKATISYFPERYGQYLVPAIVDLIEGKTVPERLIPSVSPVTRDNVEQLYPGGELDETAMGDEDEYQAVIREASGAFRIGYGDGLSGIPFTDSVTDNINAVAAEMGVEIVYCDNAYDQERTVECSNLLVTQQVDGVIFANWIAGTEELIAGIFQDAGIPCVSYDGPHPGCVAFGPDNYEAGVAAGQFLAQYAIDQGWDPAETELLLVWTPDVPVHKARADGATDGVRQSFAIPDENIHDIPTEGLTDTLPNVTTWATGNPDAKHVLCFGHSDQPGVDCALALEQSGYLGHAAAASLGASDEALVDLRQRSDDESVFKATISYFPERYGTYLVPAIVDLIEGKTVPERLIPSVSPVTRDNVFDLYPG